jgi:Flp pilus assembly protein TadD
VKKLVTIKKAETNKDLLIVLSELVGDAKKSLEILRQLSSQHPSDAQIQGRLLNALVDSGNLAEAVKL